MLLAFRALVMGADTIMSNPRRERVTKPIPCLLSAGLQIICDNKVTIRILVRTAVTAQRLPARGTEFVLTMEVVLEC